MAASAPPAIHLETLFERADLASEETPEPLRGGYDGPIGFERPVLYANFVTSLDGVVALGPDVPPSVISGRSGADWFVMGLLRACADAVVVGAGTLRAEPSHLWLAQRIDPVHAAEHAELRRRRGLDPDGPRLYLLTASGEIDPSLPAFRRSATVVTTPRGEGRLRGSLPGTTSVVALDAVTPERILELVRADGHRAVLTEGGPTVLGGFLGANVLDELFLTLSPRLAGRDGEAPRLGLVEGIAFPPDGLHAAALESLKRHGSHLFLRYRFRR